MEMREISPEVYVADDPIVNIGASDIRLLQQRVQASERKRVRVCTHKDVEENLHEMFVVYVRETYIRANKHLGKDESLHIIHGAADFVFFDEHGKATDLVELGEYDSGREFYVRVPDSIYHTLIIRSEAIVIHEATPGPFRPADTLYAPWAPEEGDSAGIAAFTEQLEASIAELHAGARS